MSNPAGLSAIQVKLVKWSLGNTLVKTNSLWSNSELPCNLQIQQNPLSFLHSTICTYTSQFSIGVVIIGVSPTFLKCLYHILNLNTAWLYYCTNCLMTADTVTWFVRLKSPSFNRLYVFIQGGSWREFLITNTIMICYVGWLMAPVQTMDNKIRVWLSIHKTDTLIDSSGAVGYHTCLKCHITLFNQIQTVKHWHAWFPNAVVVLWWDGCWYLNSNIKQVTIEEPLRKAPHP